MRSSSVKDKAAGSTAKRPVKVLLLPVLPLLTSAVPPTPKNERGTSLATTVLKEMSPKQRNERLLLPAAAATVVAAVAVAADHSTNTAAHSMLLPLFSAQPECPLATPRGGPPMDL